MITDRHAPPRARAHIPWPSEATDGLEPRFDGWRFTARDQLPLLPSRKLRDEPVLPTPILAIDIDGPLNPFSGSPKRLRAGGFRQVVWSDAVTYRPGSRWVPHSKLWLNPNHGKLLREFSVRHDVELVWASLWEHNAVTVVGRFLGMPRLPWVDFHGHRSGSEVWKWDAMAEFAAGRPLAWLDDAFGEPRKARQRTRSGWAAARRGLPTLCHRVDPAVGLTGSDLEVVASWLRTAGLAWA